MSAWDPFGSTLLDDTVTETQDGSPAAPLSSGVSGVFASGLNALGGLFGTIKPGVPGVLPGNAATGGAAAVQPAGATIPQAPGTSAQTAGSTSLGMVAAIGAVLIAVGSGIAWIFGRKKSKP